MPPTADKLPTTDHDTIIRVEMKMDSLTNEVRNTNSTLNSQVNDHEVRIRTIEKVHDQVDPLKGRSEIDALVLAQSTSKAERRTLAAIAAGTASLITLIGVIIAALTGLLSLPR